MSMAAITFQAVVTEEQVIRPPADVQLPRGTVQVTVKPVAQGSETPEPSRVAANERLRQCRVSLGRATGTDNEQIDADLARVYEDYAAAPPGTEP
jgi:hypothetical protein